MRNAWKLPTPNLIISVTGGAVFLQNLSPHIYKLFQKDLVSAAIATNAWIFTGGTYSGVMKEVGNALNIWRYQGTKTAFNIPCIGIVNWHATTGSAINHIQLENSYNTRKSTTPSNTKEQNDNNKGRECVYRTRKPANNEQPLMYPLDHNHTHFLMLDGGFEKEDNRSQRPEYLNLSHFELILNLRAKIEEESRKITSQRSKNVIPIVQILINGGPSTILTFCEAIGRKTPVLVIHVREYIGILVSVNHIVLHVF
ncbi:unnamed protein product [Rotaria sordida]|uniref:TRPM SLOG domain-containing protein n=1 Tax=Rotaria sordida TaxID=392033 RepID=A0A815LA96_9BILA|nr:unnamed protein product [Rotaria sordida]